jgi:transposase
MTEPVPKFLVGVDWATQAHQVCILDVGGKILAEFAVAANGDGLFQLVERLRRLEHDQPSNIHVSIEVNHGPVVETLMDAGFSVYAINPKQLDRFRDRHTVAGAKDDRRDAYVLADSLRTDQHLFRFLQPEEPLVVELREWSRMSEDLGHERVRLANRIREQLRRYFPQVLEIDADVAKDWVLDIWDVAPTPSRARCVHVDTFTEILKKHRIRKIDGPGIQEILQRRPVTVAGGTEEAAVAHIRLAAERIRVVNTQIKSCHEKLDEITERLSTKSGDPPGQVCEQHDVQILRSLPGVGRIVLAILLAEAARPLRERDYQAIRSLSGIAPVTKASGKKCMATMRKACNHRLRNAIYHWSRVAAQCDPWSKAYYKKLRKTGKSHGRALRGLGDRLLAIACSMLRHKTTYDPSRRSSAA